MSLESAWNALGVLFRLRDVGLSHLQSLDPGLNGNLPAPDQNIWLSRFSPAHLKYVHWNLWWGLHLLSDLQTG
jgi:hypothetical protein